MIAEEVSSLPITPKMVDTFHQMLVEIVLRHMEKREPRQQQMMPNDAG